MNPTAPSSDLAGRVLGHYEIHARIGVGGMGEVWKSRHRGLGTTVAVKTMPPGFQNLPVLVERFRREAQVMARLRHPNIVQVTDFGDEEGIYYFAMEFVEGETLADRIKRTGAQAIPEAVRLMDAIASALDAAHAQGVIHRDLKPSNVLLSPDGGVKVADFGLARILEGMVRTEGGQIKTASDADSLGNAKTADSPGPNQLSTPGQILGTLEYMSPEQRAGESVNVTTDVYSLAVMAFEMLMGRRPRGIEYPHKLRADLSSAVTEAIHRGMGAPETRPPTAGAFVDELKRALAQSPMAMPSGPTKARPWAAVIAAAVAVGAIGFAAYQYWPRPALEAPPVATPPGKTLWPTLTPPPPPPPPPPDGANAGIERKQEYDKLAGQARLEKDPARALDLWKEAKESADAEADIEIARKEIERLEKEVARIEDGKREFEKWAEQARNESDANKALELWRKAQSAAEVDEDKEEARLAIEALVTAGQRKKAFDEVATKARAEKDPVKALALWEQAEPLADLDDDKTEAGKAIEALTLEIEARDNRKSEYDRLAREARQEANAVKAMELWTKARESADSAADLKAANEAIDALKRAETQRRKKEFDQWAKEARAAPDAAKALELWKKALGSADAAADIETAKKAIAGLEAEIKRPVAPRDLMEKRKWRSAFEALRPALAKTPAEPWAVDLAEECVKQGTRLAFSTDRNRKQEIFVMGTDGSNPTLLTGDGTKNEYPVWSPDGRRIAFESNRSGESELWVMDADGSNPKQFTKDGMFGRHPAWSPDGKRLAFVSEKTGNDEIYVMDADGTNLKRVTENPGLDRRPHWSPDGKLIAFVSTREKSTDIFTMEPDGSNVKRLTSEPLAISGPVWSPDGKRIAFESNRETNWDLFVMNADGSEQTRLKVSTKIDWQPAWSPDGRRLAFVSEKDGNREVYTIRLDGTDVRRLTETSGRDEFPSWSPLVDE